LHNNYYWPKPFARHGAEEELAPSPGEVGGVRLRGDGSKRAGNGLADLGKLAHLIRGQVVEDGLADGGDVLRRDGLEQVVALFGEDRNLAALVVGGLPAAARGPTSRGRASCATGGCG
jgi:hypothetical protein